MIHKLDKEQALRELLDYSKNTIGGANGRIVGICEDGVAVATGMNFNNACNITEWKDITAIGVDLVGTFGLCSNGTLVYTGKREAVSKNEPDKSDIQSWQDIQSFAWGWSHSVGLKTDGTAIAVGYNGDGACDVGHWKDIVAIVAGSRHTAGLKADGTVLYAGVKASDSEYICDVSNFGKISRLISMDEVLCGIRLDGTLSITGDIGNADVNGWHDIVDVALSYHALWGLRKDGTICGTIIRNPPDEKRKGYLRQQIAIVESWHDIAAISAPGRGEDLLGIQYSGNIVAAMMEPQTQIDVTDWSYVATISGTKTYSENYYCYVGLKMDGTVVRIGDNSTRYYDAPNDKYYEYPINVEGWRLRSPTKKAVEMAKDQILIDNIEVAKYLLNMVSFDSEVKELLYKCENPGDDLISELKNNIYAEAEKAVALQDYRKALILYSRIEEYRDVKLKRNEIIGKLSTNDAKAELRKSVLQEQVKLEKEYQSLGLFAGRRKKEISARLHILQEQIKSLN